VNGHELEPQAKFCTVCGASAGGMSSPYQEQQPRRPAPGTGVVWAVTLVFAVFGVIPASIQASAAHRDGYSPDPYWKAFWISIVIVVAFWLSVGLVALANANANAAYG
jgi:hypothetical protein